MKVIIRESAEDDLDRIFEWIAKDNRSAAAKVVAKIRDRINLLEIDSLAKMGRPGLVGWHSRIDRISLHHRLRGR